MLMEILICLFDMHSMFFSPFSTTECTTEKWQQCLIGCAIWAAKQ
jgi:hypothetical protein